MRRLLVLLAVFVLAAGAGFAVSELTGRAARHVHVVDSEGATGLELRADRLVTPLDDAGLRPGTRFRYSFHVTNAGDAAMRHVVVRSVKVASPATGKSMIIVAVSDPACWGVGHIECIFRRLRPGETRTVHVTVESSARNHPGERLMIRTFTGRFSGIVGGSIPLQVVGEPRVTTGRFG